MAGEFGRHFFRVVCAVIFISSLFLLRVHAQRNNPAAKARPAQTKPQNNRVGDQACASCHSEKVNSYLQTSHHLTSSLPSKTSIHGSFAPGANEFHTSNRYLYYSMQATPRGFFQSAVEQLSQSKTLAHTERIDLVIGSGRKGQTYLFWKGDRLFELPVSYKTELNAWINSPGYPDGSPRFDRPVKPRCLECHSTSFEAVPDSGNQYRKPGIVLGIACEKCHGPGGLHTKNRKAKKDTSTDAAKDIINPASLPRDRQIDTCALCHAGAGKPIAPALSFVPGDVLAENVFIPDPGPNAEVDVHGNQFQLLERSRCFKSSRMTCTTCHDVHKPQRDAVAFSQNCLTCHKAETHLQVNADITNNCVDCHMPLQESQVLFSDNNGRKFKPLVRNHRIAIYNVP
jgi:hypothetical protein